MRIAALTTGLVACVAFSAFGQEQAPAGSTWTFKDKFELRANYRDSHEERFALKFPFPAGTLPPGQSAGFLQTVDPGTHLELSVVQIQLDASYGPWFAARAKVHGQDKYRRNPTSEDRQIDADELWIRFGEKPEFLDRPAGTSLFLQAGKFPKMERQPTRLLESYGLAATAFNRMEDVQVMTGGTVGRNFYWRVQASTGNPLYLRDPNALAGDNGVKGLLQQPGNPKLQAGFPILYNAETEGYFLRTDHIQMGEGLGYRWANSDDTMGFDAIAFHYRRALAERESLYGTFYGGDLDILNGPELPGRPNISLPIHGHTKEETGGRIYAEWHGLTTIAQYTAQYVAGLHRSGYEWETGYRFATSFGPSVDGESFFQSVQPVVRVSGLRNTFRAAANKQFVSPSFWWPWTKIDYGVRVGFAKNVDVTAEYAKNNVGSPKKLDLDETLVTLRIRI